MTIKDSDKLKTELSKPSRRRKVVLNLTLRLQLLFPDLLLILQICLFNSTTSRPFGGTVAERRLPMTCVMNATNLDTGGQTVPIEAASNLHQGTTQQHKIKDKYLNLVDRYLLHGHMNILFEHVKYFDKVDFSKFAKGVKSSLSKNVAFWEHIGASKFIIITIKSGYMIPFMSLAPPMKFRNNKSAADNTDFVNEAVLELLKNGCVHEVPFKPFVVNPLIQCLEWLGLIWDSISFSLAVSERRLNDAKESLDNILNKFPIISARQLAQFTGRIISMSPVMGNVTSLMTRHLYFAIENRKSWDGNLNIVYTECVLAELRFWSDSLTNLNQKNFVNDTLPNIVVYSDASNVAADIFSVGRWSSEILSPHQPLQNLAKCLPEFCLHSRAENTRKKYRLVYICMY
ncbi:unnamed protein product [Mytilus coruscus]|uniref:Uncharacterized protein n=1 Tax=Mytilus coruscus TaxID=42192 RepID=A0A6J8E6D4_MYTCO|nr:unnamed protein product [Mytilus coruscus]